MNRKRLILIGLALTTVTAGAVAARGAWTQLKPIAVGVPTTRVVRGDVVTDVHATGELRTPKTMMLTAPPVGGQMRILSLKPTGSVVKRGEVVLVFDPSDQQYRLEEQESLLKEAELEIEKLKADSAAQAGKDRVDRLTAQFEVRKGELDVSGNELLGSIEARKRELTLEEARRRLAQLDDDIKSRQTTNEAAMTVLVEKRNKARLMMDDAQKTIAQMTITAPLDGVVSVQGNQEGNFFIVGMPTPEYREGDNVSSGRSVAEVLDVASLELVARVAETDASRIALGQRAEVVLESGAGATTASQRMAANVSNIGGIRGGGNFRQPEGPVRRVDVMLRFDKPIGDARPGLSARVLMKSDPLKNVLSVPRQAVFDREGKPHVFVKSGDRFTLTPIKIAARTETAVVVQDLQEGTEVALADPDIKPGQTTPTGPAAPAGPPRMAVAR